MELSKAGTDPSWSTRWNPRMAFSAIVHLMHSAAILLLTLFVPGDAGFYLRCVWAVAATYSVMGLLMLLRVGSYEGTTDEEVGGLIRKGYWVATGLYLCLLAVSLYFILRAR
ncbi:MAG: hypothetical protein JO090_05135 [Rhizobacter sp.]|nr:hypothetical protein [Rhizobacter sp.]